MSIDAAYVKGMERLVSVVQELSMARDLASIMAIVRVAAREISGADGATFVLRDVDKCFYADEDAISPLWKGKRFPIEACISGWAMLHREPVVLEDIYADPRIPADAYRPTFVKSLAMVPIRRMKPVGAIGNYWAVRQRPSDTVVKLLQALADSTSTAMENVEVMESLERRVAERTDALAVANRELEAFAYAVSHDLRAPLRSIEGFGQMLTEDHAADLPAEARAYLARMRSASSRMSAMIEDLLQLSQVSRSDPRRGPFDLAPIAREVLEELACRDPDRRVDVTIAPTLPAVGDARLVRSALENLLGNAWKFTSRREAARIEVGMADGAYFVRDNGAGFDPADSDKLFTPFQRLHDAASFEGTGIGLATVERIVRRHGGKVWAASAVDQGATFYFTLG